MQLGIYYHHCNIGDNCLIQRDNTRSFHGILIIFNYGIFKVNENMQVKKIQV